MKTGIIKHFNDGKGYGFIESDGKNYFFHCSELNMKGYKVIAVGTSVTFEVQEGDRGPMATNIFICQEPKSFRNSIVNKNPRGAA